jgi:hypothetical protein
MDIAFKTVDEIRVRYADSGGLVVERETRPWWEK